MSKVSVLQLPDPREQWRKTPCVIDKAVEVQNGKNVEVSTAKTVLQVDDEPLRLDEAKAYVESVLAKAKDKVTEGELEDVSALVDAYGNGESEVKVEVLEANLRAAATLGVGCSGGCGRFWVLEPSVDMESYVSKSGLLNVWRLLDGSVRIVCDGCGYVTVLKK